MKPSMRSGSLAPWAALLPLALAAAGVSSGCAPAESVARSSAESGEDERATSTPATPDGAEHECGYYAALDYLVRCDGGWETVDYFVSEGRAHERCPAYYMFGPRRYEVLADALAQNRCEARCVYAPKLAVDLLRCGVHTGYTVYSAARAGCPDVIEATDGIYDSYDAWAAAHPCSSAERPGSGLGG